MNKRFHLTILIILFIPITLFSQIKITGKIINQKEKALELIEVLILSKDSIALKSELTNTNGEFFLSIEKGEYLLQVRQIGIILYKQKINAIQDLNLGILKIIENTQQLAEIVITTKKKLIERKVDRLVFNVENSIAATGGDALDALTVTPGLRVQNDQIAMIGKSGMGVMIDDRIMQLSGDDLTNFLKTIKSDDIKSIEVITTPPAKYDAEGNSGLINIKLKKAKQDSWNSSVNSSYKQSTYATGSVGGNFNYQKDKLSFFSNANYLNGSIKRNEKDEVYLPNQAWITDFNKRLYSDSFGGRVGLDYKITNKWSSGIQYLGNKSNPKTKERDFGVITNNNSAQIDSLINTTAKNIKKNWNHSINWHNSIKIDTLGKLITTDVDYFALTNENNRDFVTQNYYSDFTETPEGFLSTINLGNQEIQNISGKVDFEHPLKWANLSYGGKISFTETDNDLRYYDITSGTPVLNYNQSNTFNFKENTESLYLSGNKKFSKDKWELKLGIRMENTQTKGFSKTLNETNSNHYIEFFPTAYIVYTPNNKQSFSLDYSRRIQRPHFGSLNPFKFYSSAYSYTEGNPYLLPQFSNIIEIKHSYNDFLFTSLSYVNETQGQGEVPFVDIATSTQYFTQLNYFTYNSFVFSESYIFNKLPWFESSNQADVYYAKSKFTQNISIDNTQSWGFSFSTNNVFVLNKSKGIKAGVNYFYQAPQYDLLYKNKSFSSLDLTLKYSLLKNNMQIVLAAQDIFKTNKAYGLTYIGDVKQINTSYGDRRLFRISISYKFGSKKVNVEKRDLGNEEEKRRTN